MNIMRQCEILKNFVIIVNFLVLLSSRIVYNVSENREIAFRENVLSFSITSIIHDANIVAKTRKQIFEKNVLKN